MARVLFAMGRDGKLPTALARVHPQRGSAPGGAGARPPCSRWCIGAVFLDHVAWLTSIVAFGALTAFAFAHLSVLAHLRKGHPHRRQWVRHGLLPACGLVVALGILWNLDARAQWVGLGWMGLGVVGAAGKVWKAGRAQA